MRELRQNLNKIHGDLLMRYDSVEILEKESISMNKYFEICIKNDNKEIKLHLKKSDIVNEKFNWKYFSNPLECEHMVERVSTVSNFSDDIQDIFKNNRFDSDYIKNIK